MYWQKIQAEAARLHRATEDKRAELARLQADRDLTDEAKQRRAAEIRAELSASLNKARAAAAEHVEAARASWLEHMPSAIQRRAALSKGARAAEVRALASGASLTELAAIARELEASGDAAGAYGARQALEERFAAGTVTAEDRETVVAISRSLDAAGTRGWEGTRADLVAAQVALAEIDAMDLTDPSSGHGVLTNPLGALSGFREAATVPMGDNGATATLSPSEVQEALAVVGMREQQAA